MVVSLSWACDDCSCNEAQNPIACGYTCQEFACDPSLGEAAYQSCLDACFCDCYDDWCEADDEDAGMSADASIGTDAAGIDASTQADAATSTDAAMSSDASMMDAGRTEQFCRIVCAERVNPNDEEQFSECMADCYAGTIP